MSWSENSDDIRIRIEPITLQYEVPVVGRQTSTHFIKNESTVPVAIKMMTSRFEQFQKLIVKCKPFDFNAEEHRNDRVAVGYCRAPKGVQNAARFCQTSQVWKVLTMTIVYKGKVQKAKEPATRQSAPALTPDMNRPSPICRKTATSVASSESDEKNYAVPPFDVRKQCGTTWPTAKAENTKRTWHACKQGQLR
ncbi:unnamed protein product [Soboliphyme baturini]|uniref:MSP domain-containing protein n=1 Tax=Soboliphyme baturini TaxID=241478 RepID=A0A183IER5_9BILA|nr:unnamed protein product [Soboliphyme baturini]